MKKIGVGTSYPRRQKGGGREKILKLISRILPNSLMSMEQGEGKI